MEAASDFWGWAGILLLPLFLIWLLFSKPRSTSRRRPHQTGWLGLMIVLLWLVILPVVLLGIVSLLVFGWF